MSVDHQTLVENANTSLSGFSRIFRFSGSALWKLFLNAGIFTHVWTFILFLRDFQWVVERNDTWDAIGVGAYGLVVALFESTLLFFLLVLLGLILPNKWSETKRLVFLCILVWAVGLSAVSNQMYFLLGKPFPEPLIHLLVASDHPLRIIYAGIGMVSFSALMVPIFWIVKSDKIAQRIAVSADRSATLMSIYLVIDLISLVIVIIRNLQ
jgi:hypothetical protein